MIPVLHGTWVPNIARFFLWGEAAARTARRGRQAQVPMHPFQFTNDALHERLAELPSSATIPAERELTIWLPSAGGAPLPLREQRAAGAEVPTEAPTLAPWRVRGLLLEPQQALEALLALGDQHDAGTDLRAWRSAALLVLELVAGQQFLPALVRDGQRLRAVWQPRPTPVTARKFAALARALPPLCRAVTDDATAAPASRTLVDTFLAATTDALARTLAATKPELTAQLTRKRQALGGAWLTALLGPDPLLALQGRPAEELFTAWQTWADQEHVAGDESFRITFRLDAPSDEQAAWALSYLLQATDDPSLLVPVAQIWRERGQLFHYLDRRFAHPQERMLRGLGFAARLCPPIERSLLDKAPDRATLSTDEAFAFLKEAAPLLEQSGFGVLVPAWWGSGAQLKARLRANPRKTKKKGSDSSGRLSFANMISFNWELSLGDQPLDVAEFERLVALKQPLVQVRGQWVALDPAQMQRALTLFQRGGELTMTEALRLGLGGAPPPLPSGIAYAGMQAEGSLDELLRGLASSQQLEPLTQPASFVGQLRPYQERGLAWLAFMRRVGLGACLADDMGLGKCLLGSSLIFVNGTLKPIEQIWQQFAGATACDGEGLWAEPTAPLLVNAIAKATGQIVAVPVRRLYRQHVQEPLRTVCLEDGSTITLTRSHKFLTNKGWAADVQVGDYVCVPAQLVWAGVPADLDLIRLLAWQLAEGYEANDQAALKITQKDLAVLEALLETLKRIGQRYALKLNKPAIRTSKGRIAYLQLTSRAYQRFLATQGYQWGRRSAEKVIPDFVLQADDEGVRTFLRAYFDAEASVIAGMASIEIATASPLLMQQLVTMLRRFGIWMRVAQKWQCATNGARLSRPYQIGVIGGTSARRFLREVGFGNPRKQQLLEQICTVAANWPSPSLLPSLAGREEDRIRMRQVGSPLPTGEGLGVRAESAVMLDQEVFFCRVKSIEERPYTGWVYDLEVADQHNFVANNMLCHNTAQTIALFLHEQAQAPESGPTLLVCPTSVVGNWQRELARFAPTLRVHVHQGAERLRDTALTTAASAHEVVITSYPLLARDSATLQPVVWRTVVLDEAQNIKNSETRQAQAARALQAQTRLALTGTPVENRLTELWSIMTFLNPGYLGGETEFRRSFARPIERAGDTEAAEHLRRLTAPFILRRLKTDRTIISDLPDKLEMKVFVPLTQEQATLYEATVRDALSAIEDAESEDAATKRRGLVLAMLTKLKQICNHPANFLQDGSALRGRSGKLARLDEMLEELLAAGDRALIFTQFAAMGTLLQAHLAAQLGTEALFLHGGTPAKQRDGMVRQFQAAGGPSLFILSLKAGGVGLNLTRANHVFHFDRWWNPAVEDQATDRAFRIGQVQRVQVHKFVCGGTLEEQIDGMIESKRALAAQVLGAGEGWLTELSTDRLRELVTLRRTELSDE